MNSFQVTEDTHFGHAKIIEFCDRPFKDVQEMNEKLVENWNAVIGPDDWVFHLGDIAFGGDVVWEEWIPKLNGKICLILGNHDMKNIKEKYLSMFYWVGNQTPECARMSPQDALGRVFRKK